MFEHRIPPETPRERLDRYAADTLPGLASRSAARKAIKQGRLLLDGVSAESSRFVLPGQMIQLLPEPEDRHPPFRLRLPVVFEDESIAVINKPPGFPVSGNRHRTILHALPHNLRRSHAIDVLAQPQPVHRLDAPTGGLLVIAKTAGAAAHLGHQFERREVEKSYCALIVGRLDGEGTATGAVEGREAITHYRATDHTRCLKTEWMTTIELRPRTGRTHQLRRHMADLGHPILGDPLYTSGPLYRGKGLFLFAAGIEFEHPALGTRLELSAPEPDKFESFRKREARRWRRHRAEASTET